jgi:hypothetical protein
MMRILFSFALALACSVVLASPGGTYRAGSKVLSPGDPSSKVLDNMGQPESKEPVENKHGARTGEYWYYHDGNKTVKFFISGGRIVDIDEIRS